MLGQIFMGQSKEENAHLLQGEFENPVQGEAFWEGFNELALEYKTSLPCKSINDSECDASPDSHQFSGFQFNLANEILGHFVDNSTITMDSELDEVESTPCGLPYFDFIATRLLPCSPVDGQIEKFTGSDDTGDPPSPGEDLMTVLHAFTHYFAIFSCGNLLICDLQGRFVYLFELASVHQLILSCYRNA